MTGVIEQSLASTSPWLAASLVHFRTTSTGLHKYKHGPFARRRTRSTYLLICRLSDGSISSVSRYASTSSSSPGNAAPCDDWEIHSIVKVHSAPTFPLNISSIDISSYSSSMGVSTRIGGGGARGKQFRSFRSFGGIPSCHSTGEQDPDDDGLLIVGDM